MNKWDELSMAEKNQLIGIYVSKGYRDLAAITAHYNSFAEGGRMDNPPDKDPVLKDRKPQANFYQRLLDKNRQTIPAWENRIFGGNTVATHRMSWATDANDNAIVYPEVQEINGKLYDFTDPRNKESKSAARDRAIETGDTIMMTPAQANFWTQHYKEFYPSFATGGQMEIGDKPPKRVRRNDSPTQQLSEKYEDKTAKHIAEYKADKINHDYDIPYIAEKEIIVPGVGRVSTNALDSIAKYSTMAGISLEEGLGLAAQETAFGAIPYLNYGDNTEANRALGNTSYFRNYGTIPASYLVRDWHYFDLTNKQRESTPPLLDAFTYWKQGKYNTGDKSHTKDVRAKGRQVINTTPVQQWMKTSKYVKKKKK